MDIELTRMMIRYGGKIALPLVLLVKEVIVLGRTSMTISAGHRFLLGTSHVRTLMGRSVKNEPKELTNQIVMLCTTYYIVCSNLYILLKLSHFRNKCLRG